MTCDNSRECVLTVKEYLREIMLLKESAVWINFIAFLCLEFTSFQQIHLITLIEWCYFLKMKENFNFKRFFGEGNIT